MYTCIIYSHTCMQQAHAVTHLVILHVGTKNCRIIFGGIKFGGFGQKPFLIEGLLKRTHQKLPNYNLAVHLVIFKSAKLDSLPNFPAILFAYMYTHTCVPMHIHACTYTHAHTHIHTYPCTHTHTYIYKQHIPMHTRTYTCTYTHTQEVVGIHAAQEAEEQLLYLARHGQRKRRKGPRGDPS